MSLSPKNYKLVKHVVKTASRPLVQLPAVLVLLAELKEQLTVVLLMPTG